MNRGCLFHAGRGLAVAITVWLIALSIPFGFGVSRCWALSQSEDFDVVWNDLVDRLVQDGWDKGIIESLFVRSGIVFDPKIMAEKVDALTERRFAPRPANGGKSSGSTVNEPAVPPLEQSGYRYYLKPWVIAWARTYTQKNNELFEKAHEAYGVPTEFQAAILLVESKLGSTLGNRKAFEVLSSMAATANFELLAPHLQSISTAKRRQYAQEYVAKRSQWAYSELAALLHYAQANKNQDPTTIPSSIYGAIGICQFLPSNALHYGVDGNGDGRIDLFTLDDAIPSLANYLKEHGWRSDLTEEERDKILYAYNHSTTYVRAISTIASQLKSLSESANSAAATSAPSGAARAVLSRN